MAKLTPGQQLRGIPASDWNRFDEAANRILPAGLDRLRLGDPGKVLVFNDSGGDVQPFRLLGIFDARVKPGDDLDEFRFNPAIWGDKPQTAKYIGKFCVAQEWIADGDTGVAQVSGLTVIEVQVPSPTQYPWPYVDIIDDAYHGHESWHGAAEILAGPYSHAGSRYALCRLGPYQSPTYRGVVQETGGITAGGSGDVDIKVDGTLQETVTAHHVHMAAANDANEDAECLVRFYRDLERWEIVELEC